jgi:hypothetical protein
MKLSVIIYLLLKYPNCTGVEILMRWLTTCYKREDMPASPVFESLSPCLNYGNFCITLGIFIRAIELWHCD